jgi:hypothetical protein
MFLDANHTSTSCTRLLSIRRQFVRVCWAYAVNLYPYTQHTHSICTRMLSIRNQFVLVCSAYAGVGSKIFVIFNRMLSMRHQIVLVCSAYAINLYSYAQHTQSICTRMLSISLQMLITKTLRKARKRPIFWQIFSDPPRRGLKEPRFSFHVGLAL